MKIAVSYLSKTRSWRHFVRNHNDILGDRRNCRQLKHSLGYRLLLGHLSKLYCKSGWISEQLNFGLVLRLPNQFCFFRELSGYQTTRKFQKFKFCAYATTRKFQKINSSSYPTKKIVLLSNHKCIYILFSAL